MFSAEFRELIATLADEEYRREFVSENIATGIAFQIRHLRDSRGWTQSELAERIQKAQQETISQWESPNYGSYSVNTLKKLAAAFDVGLLVKFAPFSELADWVVNLTPESLAPPTFNEEFQHAFASVGTSQEDSTRDFVAQGPVKDSAAGYEAPTFAPARESATKEREFANATA